MGIEQANFVRVGDPALVPSKLTVSSTAPGDGGCVWLNVRYPDAAAAKERRGELLAEAKAWRLIASQLGNVGVFGVITGRGKVGIDARLGSRMVARHGEAMRVGGASADPIPNGLDDRRLNYLLLALECEDEARSLPPSLRSSGTAKTRQSVKRGAK